MCQFNGSDVATSLGGYTDDSGVKSMANKISDIKKNVPVDGWLFSYAGDEAKSTVTVENSIDIGNLNSDENYLAFQSVLSRNGGTIHSRKAQAKVEKASLVRRYLDKNPKVIIKAAKDNELIDLSYKSIIPTIAIDDTKGGTSNSGTLYLGSVLNIKSDLEKDVFYTNSVQLYSGGNLISEAKNANAKGEYSVKLSKDNTEISTTDDTELVVNVSRRQNITAYCDTSMIPDADGNVDKDLNAEKVNTILKGVTVTYHSYNEDKASFDRKSTTISNNSNQFKEDNVKREGSVIMTEYQYTSKDKYENIESVNFNLKDGTCILYHGVCYDGDAIIPIQKVDFLNSKIRFQIYTADAVSYERDPVILSQKVSALVRGNWFPLTESSPFWVVS